MSSLRRRLRFRRKFSTLILAIAGLAVLAPAAFAVDPSVNLSGGADASVLYGRQLPVSLTASAPAGQDFGYNLAFREVLPLGVSYVAGSAGADAGEPTIIANKPLTGQTTLIWGNVADLSANSTYTLSFKTAIDQTKYDVGNTFQTSGGAYLSKAERYTAKFDANGAPVGPSPTSFTSSANVGPTTTQITAIDIVASEPSPEGEIMRGVHDHQTTYTLDITNNLVNPTNNVIVEDWLPAGLEFLGCGGSDSPDNSAGEEYPGAGAITVATQAECLVPTKVETVTADPDGSGPLPSDVYTHVVFPSLGNMTAGATARIKFKAAIPIRMNVDAWPGATPNLTGAQAVNLDNNTGDETFDEQLLRNGARASGKYKGTLAVEDRDVLDRTAEDLAVQKSGSSNTLRQGDVTKWTLQIEASEYRTVDDVQVDDVLPDGLCPLGSSNYETVNESTPPSKTECDPVSGKTPNFDYQSVTENTDGTWNLHWDKTTMPSLGHLDPNDTRTITFYSRTRTHYQQNFDDTTVLLTHDGVTNNVSIHGPDFVRVEAGSKIDHDEVDGIDDLDVSGAGQGSGGPILDKRVAAAFPASGDCRDADFTTDVPVYHYGDRVCWQLRIVFPSGLNTNSLGVTDFLPPGVNFIPGTERTMSAGGGHTTPADNTVAVSPTDTSDLASSNILRWQIGSAGIVGTSGEVFDYVFATELGSPDGHLSGDITGNLVKFSSQNTAGQSFPLRDKADFTWSVPTLSLTKGVKQVNGDTARAANTDGVSVQGGDLVTWRVDVTNNGTQSTNSQVVWDTLPAYSSCTDVSLPIPDGGTCDSINNRIVWNLSANTIAPTATKTLTYTLKIPDGISPGETVTNKAGVRSYTSLDDQNQTQTFVPSNNIDPAQTTTNTSRADDTSNVFTPAAATTKTRITSVTEAGNSLGVNTVGGAGQATVGEDITYTVTTTIPQGTTMYGTPKVTDVLGTRQAYIASSLGGTLNNGTTTAALPTAGVSVAESSNTITATFPTPYVNPAGSGDDVLTLTFKAKVLDQNANRRSQTLPNKATLTFKDSHNADKSLDSNTINTTIVEPSLSLAKSHTGGAVFSPGAIVPFTVTATNTSGSNVSVAHEIVVVDTVPTGLTPVDGSGNAIADGGTVGAESGTWNATARTVTWNVASLDPGVAKALHLSLKIDVPATAGQLFTNNAAATTTSLAGTDAGERTATTATTASVSGYSATASDQIKATLPTIAKSVTPTSVTIGNKVSWTVTVTLPKDLNFFDTTIVDTVPSGFDVDSYGAITGLSGVTTLAPAISGNTTIAAWYAGDIPSSTSDRTVTMVLNGHLRDTYRGGATKVLAGQTLVNSASIKTNRSDVITTTPTTVPASFDDTVGPATATNTVIEPNLAIDKSADKGPKVIGGDHVAYAIKVTNNGTSPAYDVVVDDTPDTELTNVVLGDGSGFNTDGWTAGDRHMRWVIPGPIAPGDANSVILRYTGDVVGSSLLHTADTITNTANINQYFGVPSATRTTDGFTYRTYTGPNDTVTLTPEFPTLQLTKTTGASGNPDSASAEIGQSFTWRVVVKNNTTYAAAKGIDIVDTLPADWVYVHGTSSIGGDPSISGQTLTWTNVTDLAAGASVTLTFDAKPLNAAKAHPNPQVNSAVSTGDDSTGASGNADGPYTSNTDTANAVLALPSLLTVKTPDHGAATAGTDSSFTVKVTNNGTGTARGVSVTDALPAGLTYTPGTATATPSAGFVETQASGLTIKWTLGAIAPGATGTITVPVHVASTIDPGTTLVNTATAHDDDATADATDTGSLDINTKADVTVTKVDDPDPVYQGTNLTYTIVAHNAGPSESRNTKVVDPLPAHTTFVSASAGCVNASNTVTCTIGTMAPGADKTFTVVVLVDAEFHGSLHNVATVSTTTTETDSTNNTGTADTTVLERADVSITKVADKSEINAGETVTYTLGAHNDGPGASANTKVTDTLPAELEFVSSNPGAPTCTATGQVVTCNLGTMAPHTDRTVTITAKARGDVAGTHIPGTGDHLVPITKVEQQVDFEAGEARTVDLSCPAGTIMSDGSPRIDAVDQGTGTLADVKVIASHSISLTTYEFKLENTATGRAQAKVFGTCLPDHTSVADGHSHTINVGALMTQTNTWGAGKHTVVIDCGCGNAAIAPGFEFSGGAEGRVVTSENDGSKWKFTVDVTTPGDVTLSVRPLDTRTGTTDGHQHKLDLRDKVVQVQVPAGQTISAPVICDDDAKGLVATYDLPDDVLLLGDDPQPKTRVFKLMNTGSTTETVTIDLVCIGDRTGAELDPAGRVTNTAHISTTTAELITSNNDASACIVVDRAPGSGVTDNGAGSGSGSGSGSGDAPAPAASDVHSSVAPSVARTTTPAPAARTVAPALVPVSLASPTVTLSKTTTRAAFTLSCTAKCSGTVKLTVGKVVVGTAKFTTKKGGKVVVTVKIAKKNRALLRKAGSKAKITITTSKGSVTKSAKLKAAKKTAKKTAKKKK